MVADQPDPLRKVVERVSAVFNPPHPIDQDRRIPVVYGSIGSRAGLSGSLLFLPEEKAQWLAQLFRALACPTWGEFAKLCPPETYQDLRDEYRIKLFEDHPELLDENEDDGDRYPEPDDPQDVMSSYFEDGMWPPSRRWLMLTTLPGSILSKYVVVVQNTDSAFGEIPGQHEAALVADLEAAGYRCRRDDELIYATTDPYWGD